MMTRRALLFDGLLARMDLAVGAALIGGLGLGLLGGAAAERVALTALRAGRAL